MRRVLHHVVDRPLPRPAQGVHARVHHQAAGTEDGSGEVPEAVVRVAVEVHVLAEALGVEAPALNVGRVDGEAGRAEEIAGNEKMR